MVRSLVWGLPVACLVAVGCALLHDTASARAADLPAGLPAELAATPGAPSIGPLSGLAGVLDALASTTAAATSSVSNARAGTVGSPPDTTAGTASTLSDTMAGTLLALVPASATVSRPSPLEIPTPAAGSAPPPGLPSTGTPPAGSPVRPEAGTLGPVELVRSRAVWGAVEVEVPRGRQPESAEPTTPEPAPPDPPRLPGALESLPMAPGLLMVGLATLLPGGPPLIVSGVRRWPPALDQRSPRVFLSPLERPG